MKVPFVDLGRQLDAVRDTLYPELETICESGAFIMGPWVKRFEEAFAAYLGVPFVRGCANGTDAIELALEALGIGPGDEVIVPAHTWISTASAVNRVGARPVFADCDASTYLLDIHSAEEKIGPDTKAIIGVHLYGRPFDAPAFRSLADRRGIYLIEDTAQAHGASLNGVKAGTTGHMATFSFYPSKNLGCFGDGGCVATRDEALAQRVADIGNCGQRSKNYHTVIGRNSRLDSLQAAVLSAKLAHLDAWNDSRREAAALYGRLLDPSVLPPQESPGERHVYHLYVIRCKDREGLAAYLGERGIQSGVHYPNILPQLDVYGGDGSGFTCAGYIGEILSLPMFPGITEEEVTAVCNAVNAYVSR